MLQVAGIDHVVLRVRDADAAKAGAGSPKGNTGLESRAGCAPRKDAPGAGLKR